MKYLTLFSLLFTQLLVFGQARNQPLAVIAATRNNFVYRQIPNPLAIAVQNYSTNNIVVQTNIGKITKDDDSNYTLYLDSCKENVLTISVFVKTKKGILKKISSHYFKIFDLPEPSIAFGSLSDNGYITYEELNKTNNLYLFIKELPNLCGITYQIKSFTVIHSIKDKVLVFQTSGRSFSNEMKESFKNAKNDDQIIINNVVIPDYSRGKYLTKTLSLRVIKN